MCFETSTFRLRNTENKLALPQQHCWPKICTLRPTNRNIVERNMLRALRRVATCWVLKIELERLNRCNVVSTCRMNYNIVQRKQMLHEFDQFQIRANNTQHVAISGNISQEGGQTRATRCTQNVAIVLPGLYNLC